MTAAVRTWPDTVPPQNRTLGWPVLEWTSEFLLQPDGENAGQQWEFTTEQARILLRWYEIDAHGRFTHRRGVLRRLKGWGKDPFLAAIGLVELCGPCRFDGFDANGMPVAVPHPAAWVQVAAVSKDQTRNTMTLLPGMLSKAAIDEYGIDPGKEIVHTAARGRLEAVTSSPKSLEGGRPTLVIMNETHHWVRANDGLAMASAIRRNLAKSNNGTARSMEITNAHDPQDQSAAGATYEAWVKAKGKLPGVYYDSIEAQLVVRSKKVVPIDEMTDAQVRASLLEARGDSVWVDPDRLLAEIRDPVESEGMKRRYYFNQVFSAESETWFAPGTWDRVADRIRYVAAESDVVIAIDGSNVLDATGIVVATLGENPHVDVVELWEPPDDAPKDYRIPVLDVEDAIRRACRLWSVAEVVFDPARYQHSMAVLSDEGYPIVEYPQSSARMTPATQNFEALVKNELMTHSGHPDLARHVGNAVVTEDFRGRRIRKVNKWSKARIDLAVAAIMAVDRATQAEPVGPAPTVW